MDLPLALAQASQEVQSIIGEELGALRASIQSAKERHELLIAFIRTWDRATLNDFSAIFNRTLTSLDAQRRRADALSPIDLRALRLIETILSQDQIMDDHSQEKAVRDSLRAVREQLDRWKRVLEKQRKALIALHAHLDKEQVLEGKVHYDAGAFSRLRALLAHCEDEARLLAAEQGVLDSISGSAAHLRMLLDQRRSIPIGLRDRAELALIGQILTEGILTTVELFHQRTQQLLPVSGTRAFIGGSRASGMVSEFGGAKAGLPCRPDSDLDLLLVGDAIFESELRYIAMSSPKTAEGFRSKGIVWNTKGRYNLPGLMDRNTKMGGIRRIAQMFARNTGKLININIHIASPSSKAAQETMAHGMEIALSL